MNAAKPPEQLKDLGGNIGCKDKLYMLLEPNLLNVLIIYTHIILITYTYVLGAIHYFIPSLVALGRGIYISLMIRFLYYNCLD